MLGLASHYRHQGSGLGPTVVFSHSLGADLTMWEAQAEALAGDFGVVCYDTRGHGRSPVLPGECSIEDLAGDVLSLLDTLGLEKVVFCGLSLGGLIGQWLGRHCAERLHGLVLCSTALRIGSNESWDSRIATVERSGLTGLVEATRQRWFGEEFTASHRASVEAVMEVFERTSVQGYTSCCAAVRGADFLADPTPITVPTLVLNGLHDSVTTVADGQAIASRIEGASYHTLAAAHLCNVEAAEAFNTRLRSFLQDLSRP